MLDEPTFSSAEMKPMLKRASISLKRILDAWRSFEDGLQFTAADYLAERMSRLEREVAMLKAELNSKISPDPPRG